MWSLKSIEIKNCFSIKDAFYTFKNRRCILLTGENLDLDSGQKVNGTGKSAFLEAISINLTGQCLRKIKNRDIVFNDEDECYTCITLNNSKLNEEMKIERSLFVKGSSSVIVSINGEVIKNSSSTSVDDANTFITNKIGIQNEDLLNYYIISRDKYISFLKSNDIAKKQLINRFSKADVLDNLVLVFNEKFKQIEKDIIENTKEKYGLDSQKNLLIEQIEQLRNIDFEQYKIDKIEELSQFILKCKNLIVDAEDFKHELAILINGNEIDLSMIKLDQYDEQFVDIKAKKVDSDNQHRNLKIQFLKIKEDKDEEINLLNELKDELLSTISNNETMLKTVNQIISDINKKIMGAIECPKCKHTFLFDDKEVNVEELKNNFVEQELNKQKIIDSLHMFENELKQCTIDKDFVLKQIEEEQKSIQNKMNEESRKSQDIIEEERKLIKLLDELKLKKQNLESKIKLQNDQLISKSNSIKLLNEQIEQYNEQIETVKQSKDAKQDEIISKNKSISEFDEMIQCIDIILTSLQDEEEKIKRWQLNFKSFKSYLANKSVVIINSYVNHYLEKIGSNLSILMSGFKLKSNGELKEQISVEVFRNAVSEGDFNKFSAGEKGRIDLCCILALQNLINLASDSGGLDFIGIDEVLDAVDSYGIDSIVKSMDSINKTVFIITQNTVNESSINILLARKANKITELIDL